MALPLIHIHRGVVNANYCRAIVLQVRIDIPALIARFGRGSFP